MSSPLRVALLAFAFVLAAASSSRADEAAAREHFKKGVDLYDKKRYADALPEFRAAYAEKPSAGIKQNVGLCLKGLGRRVEAATAFDEALDEGKGTLKPETRAAMEQELVELAKVVATVTVKVVVGDRPVETAVVSVDGARLAPGAQRRPIRLEPGIHTFDAHADGFGDPPQKKLALVAGSPVDATFDLRPPAAITVRPSVADALVSIDGKQVAHGTYSGSLPPGKHHVEVAAEGFLTTAVDVDVADGVNADLPVVLRRPGEAPAEYEAPNRKPPPKRKTFYVAAMFGLEGELAHVYVPATGTSPDSVGRQTVGGLAVGLKGGYRPSRLFALEAHLELGGMEDKGDPDTKVNHWQITPVARFNSDGKVRFVMGTGIGLHGISVETTSPTSPKRTGSSVTASWLVDVGAQVDVGPLFLEPVIFVDIHGVGTVRDDTSHQRILEDSPGVRYGLRLGLGIPF